ncbi:hypothetical protein [Thomasclavelia spiroformis]|uniref:hypothetical protein n=1 Tax=Thomasclavelia spiroformis TaxID=29348 RepID=UPI002675CBF1|nr:hypothetical protein [Thomasclavelia spiroformis]
MPLTHVCIWDKKGWKKITVNQAVKMTHGFGGVSASSGLFMCELCGQYVSLTSGNIRDPYFKHSKDEENKDCPERTLGAAVTNYYNTLKLESKGLPIRVNLNMSNRSFEIFIGFPKIPGEMLRKLKGTYICIKNDSGKEFKYSVDRLEKDNITYLSVGDFPSDYYQIKLKREILGLDRFWPIKITGFKGNKVLDSKGNVLPYDSDVRVNKEYYVFGRGCLKYYQNHVEAERLFSYRLQTIYKVKARDFSEISAKFFLDLHCRLTENPISFIPLWPAIVQSPYIIYHKKNNIFGLVNGDVIFSTFPDSNISKQKIKKSNLISINCNDRQQLLSIGRASNILNYTYLWKDNLKFKSNSQNMIQIFDDKNNLVSLDDTNLLKIKSIHFTSEYDGKFIVESDGFIEEVYLFKATNRFTYSSLKKNKVYKIYQSNDCIVSFGLVTKNKNVNQINEKEILKKLRKCNGRDIPINHSFGNIADRLKDYSLIKVWIRNEIKQGIIKEDAYKLIKQITFKGEGINE